MQPIRRLTRGRPARSSAPAAPTRACRSPAPGDAIDELTTLFNAMLDKIEGLVTAMRGALDNVSHDLRTPLTRLRGTAELALAGAPDLERYREALADCVEESDRVLVMLNTLMDISEAESGTMQLQREPVALGDVVDRAVDLYRDVADAKGVDARRAERAGSRRRRSIGRSHAARTGRGEPDRQRGQVHAGRRPRGRRGRGATATRRSCGCATPGRAFRADELPRIWDRLFRGDTQPHRARPRPWPQPGQGHRRSARRRRCDVASEPGRGSTFDGPCCRSA